MTMDARRLLVVATALLTGCGAGEARQAMLVTDSAGVRVVLHPAGARDTSAVGEPLLVIGREGEPEYEFFNVGHVAPLSDGRILVSSSGHRELRLYSAAGQYLSATGGRGAGPGEFGSLGPVQLLPGDTIVANDQTNVRVSLFSGDLELIETLGYGDGFGGMPELGGARGFCVGPRYLGLTGGRTFVASDWVCTLETPGGGARDWSWEASLRDPGSAESRPLAAFRFPYFWERSSASPAERFVELPFVPRITAAYAREAVLLAHPLLREIRVHAPGGELVTVIRDAQPRAAVDAAARASHRASLSDEGRSRLQGVPYPDSLPAFDGLVFGEGQVWARHYELPDPPRRHWSVYATSGELLGTVALPVRFEPRSVAGGRLWGVARDELDVERVEVYRVPLAEGGA